MSNYLEKIVRLSEQKYNTLVANNQINENYLYITDYDGITIDDFNQTILDVIHGGTGQDHFAAGSILTGNGTSALTETLAVATNTSDSIVKRDASGNFSAGTITAALNGNAETASKLANLSVSSTTLNNTAGTFAFSGNGAPWTNYDWVGLQVGSANDKFQIVGTISANTLLYRNNDNGNINTSWGNWQIIAHAETGAAVGNTTTPIYMTDDGVITAGTPLKALAYKDNLTYSEVGAAPSSTISCTTANVKTALGTGSDTTKFLNNKGDWAVPPNDDTHVNVKTRNATTKAYLLATTTSPTSSDQAVTAVAETGVYLNTAAGYLYATKLYSGGNEVLTSFTETDPTVPSWAKQAAAPVVSVAGLNGTITSSDLREALNLSQALTFKGKTTSTMSDGFTGVPAGISNYTTPRIGDVVLDNSEDSEYVCISTTNSTYKWERLGRDSSWATSDHTHTTTITSGGNNPTILDANTTYTLNTGGTSFVFTTPSTATNVTGIVAIANGGTGISTIAAHKVLIGPKTDNTTAAPTWRLLDTEDIPDLSTLYIPVLSTSTTNGIVLFNDNSGKTIKNSGITITTNTPDEDALDTQIPTSKAVWNSIAGLDVSDITSNCAADKTLATLSETDGKIAATFQSIAISLTANATDGLWNVEGTNSNTTNTVSYSVSPYTAQQNKASFDNSSTAPSGTTRLNYNGYFYATKLYSGGTEVKTLQTALTDSDANTTPTLTFVKGITQNANGVISVSKATLATVPIGQGGTNTTSFTNKRLLYVDTNNSVTAFTSSGHYVDNTTLGINTTSITNSYTLDINGNTYSRGHIIPSLNLTAADKNLGSSDNHWNALYINAIHIGSTSTYGDAYTPIYWNNGTPATVTTIQKATFTLTTANSTAAIGDSTQVTDTTEVIQIIVTDTTSIANLKSAFTWEIKTDANNNNNNKYIEISATVGGNVDGYILFRK